MIPALRCAVLVVCVLGCLGATSDRRLALLSEAEQALSSGDVDRASGALESAAQMAHSADTELLQVRAMMQAGRYSQAAAFAAHTAGDHHEGLTPVALYAWLLVLGGQEDIGRRRLEEALHDSPSEPIALDVQRLIADPSVVMPPELFEAPHRFAPYAVILAGNPPSPTAIVAGNGVLWSESLVLVSAPVALQAKRLWVRNALGQTVPVRNAHSLPSVGLIALDLQAPLAVGDTEHASAAPFAGSPGFVADYPPVQNSAPAWPRLHHGFFGGITLSSNVRRLGIKLPPGPRGGPVFDKAGRLAGIAVVSNGGDTLVPVAAVESALGVSHATTSPPQSSSSLSFDAGYERAMRIAVQLIVER